MLNLSRFLSLFFICGACYATSVDVLWQHPTTRVNDAPLSIQEISHTEVRYACPAGGDTISVEVPANTVTIDIPYIGFCDFQVRSVDITELASEWSDVKQVMIKADAPPRPPTWVDIVVAWVKRILNWIV